MMKVSVFDTVGLRLDLRDEFPSDVQTAQLELHGELCL